MADMDVSVVLRLIDRLSGPMRKAAGGVRKLKEEMRGVTRAGGGGGLARQFSRAEVAARKVRMEVAKLKRTMAEMAPHFRSVFGRGGAVIGAAVAMKGAAASLATLLIGPAADYEQSLIQFESLFKGDPQKGLIAMNWVREFARKTPLEFAEVRNAFALLKAYGVDPMNGSLMALTDAMAMQGKGSEQLEGLIMAVGQAYTKNKLQGEEILQLQERGIPVWDLLAKKMGKTVPQLQKLAEKGRLGRKEIALLLEAIGEWSDGASGKQSKTWNGIVSNLQDQWTEFRRRVAESGPFQRLKSELEGVLAKLDEMERDGSLQRWAEKIGTFITDNLDKVIGAAKGMAQALADAARIIDQIATAAGGYQNLFYFAAALWIITPALKLIVLAGQAATILTTIAGLKAAPLFAFALGLAAIAGGMWAVNQSREKALGLMERMSGETLAGFEKTINTAAGAGMGNPLFTTLFDGLAIALKKATEAGVALRNSVDWAGIASHWAAMARGLGATVITNIKSGLGSLFSAGYALMQGLWDGIAAKFNEMLGALAGMGSRIKAALLSGVGPTVTLGGGAQGDGAKGSPQVVNRGAKGDLGGPRAMGGSMFGGRTYLVGERGPELVTPKRYGHVTPLKGGGATVNVALGGVTINGRAGAADLRRLADAIAGRIRASLHDGAYA